MQCVSDSWFQPFSAFGVFFFFFTVGALCLIPTKCKGFFKDPSLQVWKSTATPHSTSRSPRCNHYGMLLSADGQFAQKRIPFSSEPVAVFVSDSRHCTKSRALPLRTCSSDEEYQCQSFLFAQVHSRLLRGPLSLPSRPKPSKLYN